MQKRFSQMNKEELTAEADRLRLEGERFEKEGNLSQANIVKQRYYFCLSYLMQPEEIVIGKSYSVIGENKEFVVEYLNGVMAWGYYKGESNSQLVAFPIAQLRSSKSDCANGCSTH